MPRQFGSKYTLIGSLLLVLGASLLWWYARLPAADAVNKFGIRIPEVFVLLSATGFMLNVAAFVRGSIVHRLKVGFLVYALAGALFVLWRAFTIILASSGSGDLTDATFYLGLILELFLAWLYWPFLVVGTFGIFGIVFPK